jgi:hypothetical protein
VPVYGFLCFTNSAARYPGGRFQGQIAIISTLSHAFSANGSGQLGASNATRAHGGASLSPTDPTDRSLLTCSLEVHMMQFARISGDDF